MYCTLLYSTLYYILLLLHYIVVHIIILHHTVISYTVVYYIVYSYHNILYSTTTPLHNYITNYSKCYYYIVSSRVHTFLFRRTSHHMQEDSPLGTISRYPRRGGSWSFLWVSRFYVVIIDRFTREVSSIGGFLLGFIVEESGFYWVL